MKHISSMWKIPSQYNSEQTAPSVYYDIETTGLSRDRSSLYLIGAFRIEQSTVFAVQWFAESPADEPLLLRAFSEYLQGATRTVQYNGDSFDQPFLEAKCRHYNVPSPFTDLPSLDLFRKFKPLKFLLKLPNLKQPTLEQFLALPPRQYPDGAAGTKLYREYLKHPLEETADKIIGHNREDLYGLSLLPSVCHYLDLLQNHWNLQNVTLLEDQLIFRLKTEHSLPQIFSNGNSDFYLTGQDQDVKLLIHAKEHRYRYYYSNFKDYDFVPTEDTAMPKSISQFLDRSLRKPATIHNCYTWFSVNEDFLQSKERQLSFLRGILPRLLETL